MLLVVLVGLVVLASHLPSQALVLLALAAAAVAIAGLVVLAVAALAALTVKADSPEPRILAVAVEAVTGSLFPQAVARVVLVF